MVADPGGAEHVQGVDGEDIGDATRSELHEAPVAADLDEDHLTGDWVPDAEVVQDDEGDAFQIPKCLPCRRHIPERWRDATKQFTGRTPMARMVRHVAEEQRPSLSEQRRQQSVDTSM